MPEIMKDLELIQWRLLVTILFIPSSLGRQLCLSCTDVVVPRDCGEIVICGSHEQCSKSSLFVGKRSLSGLLVCSECCDGEICNNEGCGQHGYGERSQRGPVCASCPTQEFENDCNRIQVCGRDQMCSLRKTYNSVSKETRYRTECVGRTSCLDDVKKLYNLLNNILLVGKRETVDVRPGGQCILRCCDEDLCNTNCSNNTNHQENKVTASFTVPSVTPEMSTVTVPTVTSTQRSVTASVTSPLLHFASSSSSKTTIQTSVPAFTTTIVLPNTITSAPFKTTPTMTTLTSLSTSSTEDPCLFNPCAFGQCSSYRDTYKCTCLPGYVGRNCSESVTPFAPVPSTSPHTDSRTEQTSVKTASEASTPSAIQVTQPNTPAPSHTTRTTVLLSSRRSTTTTKPAITDQTTMETYSQPKTNATTQPATHGITKPSFAITKHITTEPSSAITKHITEPSTPITTQATTEPSSAITTYMTTEPSSAITTQITSANRTKESEITTSPVPLDPCASSPCQHGTCQTNNSLTFTCRCSVGFTGNKCDQKVFCPKLETGDMVIRGPNWVYGDQDHGLVGIVTDVPRPGYVMVIWSDNTGNAYRYAGTGPCEVWPVKVSPVTHTDCEAHRKFCEAHCGLQGYIDTPDLCIYCICKH